MGVQCAPEPYKKSRGEQDLGGAVNAGAIEVAAVAVCTHASVVELPERACGKLRSLSSSIMESRNLAGDADAVQAVVAALRGHPTSAEVQETASVALYFLIKDNTENKRLARRAGAKALATAALKAHHATEKVVEEAQDLVQQLL